MASFSSRLMATSRKETRPLMRAWRCGSPSSWAWSPRRCVVHHRAGDQAWYTHNSEVQRLTQTRGGPRGMHCYGIGLVAGLTPAAVLLGERLRRISKATTHGQTEITAE